MVMPKDNEANVQEDIPAHLREGMTFHFVKTIDEALATPSNPAWSRPSTPARHEQAPGHRFRAAARLRRPSSLN